MLFKWTNHNNSVVTTSAHLATPTVAAKRVEMDKSFFSDSILEFINDEEDEEEFENIDYIFGQIPDEVFTAVVDSKQQQLSPHSHVAHTTKERGHVSFIQILILINNYHRVGRL